MIRILLSIILFIVPFVVSMLTQTEFWPFSHFPMYSERYMSKKMEVYRLYGVNEQGQSKALISYKELYPLLRHHIHKKLNSLIKSKEDEKIRNILYYYLKRNSHYKRIELRIDSLSPVSAYEMSLDKSELIFSVGLNER